MFVLEEIIYTRKEMGSLLLNINFLFEKHWVVEMSQGELEKHFLEREKKRVEMFFLLSFVIFSNE